MLTQNPIADTQSQTGALADLFCREKWIEDAFRMDYPLAVIGECDLVHAAALMAGDGDAARPVAVTHSIIGVVEDVEDYLLQLVRIADDLRQVGLQFLADLDVVAAEIVGAQLNSSAND